MLLNQLRSAVDAYASQSANVYSKVPSGYLYETIDSSSIKSTIQISSIAPVTPTTTSTTATTTNSASSLTFLADIPNLLTIDSNSSTAIEPNVVFRSLTDYVCFFISSKTFLFHLFFYRSFLLFL